MGSSKRDNSPRAILARYKKATIGSILASDPIMFDSLRDIPALLHDLTKDDTDKENIKVNKACAELDEAHPDYIEPFWKRKRREF